VEKLHRLPSEVNVETWELMLAFETEQRRVRRHNAEIKKAQRK
jgi:hypothetical protein